MSFIVLLLFGFFEGSVDTLIFVFVEEVSAEGVLFVVKFEVSIGTGFMIILKL